MTEALAVGDEVPDLALINSAGERVSLRALTGEATALIFLRHLG